MYRRAKQGLVVLLSWALMASAGAKPDKRLAETPAGLAKKILKYGPKRSVKIKGGLLHIIEEFPELDTHYAEGMPFELFLKEIEKGKYLVNPIKIEYTDREPAGPSPGDEIIFNVNQVEVNGKIVKGVKQYTFMDKFEKDKYSYWQIFTDMRYNESYHPDKMVLERHHFFRTIVSVVLEVEMEKKKF